MPERYPTLEEFWKRLHLRDVEPDLIEQLRARTHREEAVSRLESQATVEALAARVLPGSVPPRALAAFLDEHFDQQLGRSDERVGLLPRAQLIPAGFAALDAAAGPAGFATLDPAQQDSVLEQAERGELRGPEGFDSAEWFTRVRGLLLLAFGSDPRGMVQMGFPGPSFQPGHVWLDRQEVEQRARRAPGYLRL